MRWKKVYYSTLPWFCLTQFLFFFACNGHYLIEIQINDELVLIIDILFNYTPKFMSMFVIIRRNVDFKLQMIDEFMSRILSAANSFSTWFYVWNRVQ